MDITNFKNWFPFTNFSIFICKKHYLDSIIITFCHFCAKKHVHTICLPVSKIDINMNDYTKLRRRENKRLLLIVK